MVILGLHDATLRDLLAAQEAAKPAEADPGRVYYAERDGFVKIGFARGGAAGLKRRLGELERGGVTMPPGFTPGPMTLLAVHEATEGRDRVIHQRFASARVAGEWFRLTPELVAHIEHVATAA